MSADEEISSSLVIERWMPHARERVWRALTQEWLIREWLMENDFQPVVGHCFTLRSHALPGWTGIVNCEVLAIEQPTYLAYRWGDGSESDSGLSTVVKWTLDEIEGGTLVRMEQSGFLSSDGLAYTRMSVGWPGRLERLEQIIGGLS
ncbi:SRPBCC domain-containing protein [Amorphus sp. 3PC139-8]|uniref:SRPBCC family protein n=1 Tax=Amorphus sp. 3PC139-8 TaxID=2735676 RepID=UPI00345CDFD6